MRTIAEFASRFRARESLVGTFVKTPDPSVVEVLSRSSLDFVVLDAEHAPFSRRELDLCLLAAREGNLPALVRVPSSDAIWTQQALDQGAVGVVVPHVRSASEAREVARKARFGEGGRGFAGSTRAADYTRRDIATHLEKSSQSVVVIAQIEDAEAVKSAFEIAAVSGVDGVFIGPVDLAISLGKTTVGDAVTQDAISHIATSVRRAEKSVGIFVSGVSDAEKYQRLGLSFVLVRSDQSFMLAAADQAHSDILGLLSGQ